MSLSKNKGGAELDSISESRGGKLPPPPEGKSGWPWQTTPSIKQRPDARTLPTISIVTTSYQQGQYIEGAVRSVVAQQYPKLEYIVMDGGSTDGSVDVIRKYENNLSSWVSEPDEGPAAALRTAWGDATGEILGFVCTDDGYYEDTFWQVAEVFANDPEVMAVTGGIDVVDVDDNLLLHRGPRDFDPARLLKGGSPPWWPCTFFRRQVIDDLGYMDESLYYIADWFYALGVGLKYRPEQLVSIKNQLGFGRTWPGANTIRGYEGIITEYGVALERIFSDPSLPEHLRPLEKRMRSRVKWRHAGLAGNNREPLKALKYAVQSWFMDPTLRDALQVSLFCLKLAVPRFLRPTLRRLIGRKTTA